LQQLTNYQFGQLRHIKTIIYTNRLKNDKSIETSELKGETKNHLQKIVSGL